MRRLKSALRRADLKVVSIGAPTADVARPFAPTAVATPRARRIPFLSISLTDLLFFAILFWLFAGNGAEGWDRLLWDGDVALHTRIGDYVLDHGQVPHQDIFSFTKPGERFYALQWLAGVAFALLNRSTGLKGIVLLAALLIALYQIVLVRDMVRRGVNGLFAIVLTLIGGNAAMIHFHARPHLFTLLFLACAGYLIARDRERQSRTFWLIVPMTALWANLHSGFPVVLVLLTLLSGGCALSRDRRQSFVGPGAPLRHRRRAVRNRIATQSQWHPVAPPHPARFGR